MATRKTNIPAGMATIKERLRFQTGRLAVRRSWRRSRALGPTPLVWLALLRLALAWVSGASGVRVSTQEGYHDTMAAWASGQRRSRWEPMAPAVK